MRRLYYFLFVLFLFIASCKENTDTHNRVKSSTPKVNIKAKISVLGNKYAVLQGNSLKVKFESKTNFDSVKFYVDDSLIKVGKDEKEILDISTQGLKHFGQTKVRAVVFKNGIGVSFSDAFVLFPSTSPKWYSYKIKKVYPHDRHAYTQGLIYEDGILYESTGLKGESSIRKVRLETGEVIQSYTIDPNIFGEGITILGDKLIQLTWQAHRGFIYDKNTFQKLGEFYYNTEGWGITHDNKHLIMSDGTNRLFFLDPQTYAVDKIVEVFDNKGAVRLLNELEYIDGKIFANVYTKDIIAIINPNSGLVEAYIDLAGLLSPSDRTQEVDVLNGIAYDYKNKRLFVTGKNWPKLFWIELLPKK